MTSGPFASRPVSGANTGAARLRGWRRPPVVSGVARGEQNRCGGREGGGGRLLARLTAAACLPRGRRSVRLHRNQTCNPQSSRRRTANWRRRRRIVVVCSRCQLAVRSTPPRAALLHFICTHVHHTRLSCYYTRIQILLQCLLYAFPRTACVGEN